jgi:hypothetical protein
MRRQTVDEPVALDRQIHWRLHLISAPARVYQLLSTDVGRASFWPESSVEQADSMTLTFLGEQAITCKILARTPPARFSFHYWGETTVVFELTDDGTGGTDLVLRETGFPTDRHWEENNTGWVSVLMNLKAVADFGVDLRNHDPQRTWKHGYCET